MTKGWACPLAPFGSAQGVRGRAFRLYSSLPGSRPGFAAGYPLQSLAQLGGKWTGVDTVVRCAPPCTPLSTRRLLPRRPCALVFGQLAQLVQALTEASVLFELAGQRSQLPIQQSDRHHAIHMADVGRDLGQASGRIPLVSRGVQRATSSTSLKRPSISSWRIALFMGHSANLFCRRKAW